MDKNIEHLPAKRIVGLAEAAHMLDMSKRQLAAILREGREIPARKEPDVPNGHWKIAVADIDAYVEWWRNSAA